MASILLSNAPYFLRERYGRLASVGATLPNLGLLMLAAMLRKEGHNIRIIDASACDMGYRETIEEVKKFHPDMVGLTAVTPAIIKTVRLAMMIKDVLPDTTIVLGGPHFTALPEQTLLDHPVFDYGVIGEGEETFMDLIQALSSGRPPADVPGIAFHESGKIRVTTFRPAIRSLDSLPFPAWDLLDGFPGRYHPAVFKYKKLPSTHIISARGCPNNCIFCDTSVFGSKVRFHSSEYVLNMIELLVKRFGIKEIIFEDDQFLLKKERVAKICEGLVRTRLSVSWCCSGRVNTVNDLELLKLMKRSGCWQISYGIESASQDILDFARKDITVEQINNAVRLTDEAGILSKGYFIFGLPHETERTMENTIRFAKQLPLNDISVFMLTPFPGSKLYEIAGHYGAMEKDFQKMNILDVVYVPDCLSREKLLYYQNLMMRKFYLRPHIIVGYIKRLLINPSNLPAMFRAFYGFLRTIFRA